MRYGVIALVMCLSFIFAQEQLILESAPPQLNTLIYDSNGFIEVANAIVLVNPEEDSLQYHLAFAQAIVDQSFAARPSLSEVDVAVYRASEYQGQDPAAPLPRFTASVPTSRVSEFSALTATTITSYERLWVNIDLEPAVIETPVEKRGTVIYQGSETSQQAMLSFDDSPFPLYTPLLLNLLEQHQVKATFFIIGRNALKYPYFVKDILAAGHQIANHTYSHQRLIYLSLEEAKAEVLRTDAILTSITGQAIKPFRFPGGRTDESITKMVRDLGFDIVFWTANPGDYQRFAPEVLELRLEGRMKSGGDIVLLHDGLPETLDTLGTFIAYVRQQGLRFVTLNQLIR
jgi:peptidoglycan-N-acetylglucosamine deacetylase